MERNQSKLLIIFSSAALAAAYAIPIVYQWISKPSRHSKVAGIEDLVGDTPLVLLAKLSAATGCNIFGKAEFLNVGGSTKDRVALQVLNDATADGRLKQGGCVVEGTSGSTGISLAVLSRARGLECRIVCQDDVSPDKIALLRLLGAQVTLVPPASIVNSGHYVNVARRMADEICRINGPGSALFCDQFDTPSNFIAHYSHTGPEIWAQTGGDVHAFVAGAGTGGTLAGVSAYLKERSHAKSLWSHVLDWTLSWWLWGGVAARSVQGSCPTQTAHASAQCFLVDPPGSSLFNKVVFGTAFTTQQAERTIRRHRNDSIIEGVGLDRVSANFARALPHLDGAFPCSDQEAVSMSRYLLAHEGLFVGSSSALGCVGAVHAARMLGPGHTIVTLLCDSGARHVAKFWDDAVLVQLGLQGTRCAEGDGQTVAGAGEDNWIKDSTDLSFVKPLSGPWKNCERSS